MLVQSGGGKVYAVIANNAQFELGILPTLALQSTTAFLALRLRYKILDKEYLDPMLVPKQVLVGGIERSGNTLRGHMMLNTGFTLDKIGAGFPDIVSQKVLDAASGFLLTDEDCLKPADMRDDFVTDFAQLVTSAIAPVYPAKDFSETPPLMNPFDLMIYTETTAGAPKSPFTSMPGGKADEGPEVNKISLKGGDYEPQIPDENEGVDKSGDGEPKISGKVHVLGQAPKDEPATAEQEPETTDH